MRDENHLWNSSLEALPQPILQIIKSRRGNTVTWPCAERMTSRDQKCKPVLKWEGWWKWKLHTAWWVEMKCLKVCFQTEREVKVLGQVHGSQKMAHFFPACWDITHHAASGKLPCMHESDGDGKGKWQFRLVVKIVLAFQDPQKRILESPGGPDSSWRLCFGRLFSWLLWNYPSLDFLLSHASFQGQRARTEITPLWLRACLYLRSRSVGVGSHTV